MGVVLFVTQCVVPFCKRFRRFPEPDLEWICGDHIRLVDRALRNLRTRFKRRATALRRGDMYRNGWVHLRILRADRTDARIWARIKRQAIERALGVA